MRQTVRQLFMALAAAAVLSATPVSAAKTPQWEVVVVADGSDSGRDNISQRETVETESRDGMLYITVDKPLKIEIYSILGQLITSRQVKPGTVRLTLNQRGVYILKAGSTTRRVNL